MSHDIREGVVPPHFLMMDLTVQRVPIIFVVV